MQLLFHAGTRFCSNCGKCSINCNRKNVYIHVVYVVEQLIIVQACHHSDDSL